MRTIDANAVRGRSYEKFYTEICHTKVSLHENFQYAVFMYPTLHTIHPPHQIATILEESVIIYGIW